MNQSPDLYPDSNRRTKRLTHLEEVCSQPGPPTRDSKHLQLLDALVDKIVQKMDDDSFQPKVRDALKAIQLREKVAKASEAESIFWNLIDDIKKEEFSEDSPVPAGLQGQIKETILGLKDVVKNGILPLKAITEAYNQARSQQARLTSRRMSSLLSAMEFTKAKTPNGCSAIIWDDQLLPQDTSSDAHTSGSDGICRSGCESRHRRGALPDNLSEEKQKCTPERPACGSACAQTDAPPGDPVEGTNPMAHPQGGNEDKRYSLPPPRPPAAPRRPTDQQGAHMGVWQDKVEDPAASGAATRQPPGTNDEKKRK